VQEHRGLTGNKLSYALLTQYICHMTFLLELLSEFVFVIVFQYPGALIRWLIAGRKRTFKEVLSDPFYWNVSVTVLLVGIIFFLLGGLWLNKEGEG